jgi:hypothetical protein
MAKTVRGIAWAGLATAPIAWAINTQAGYALVPWACAHRLKLIPPLAGVLLALSLVAGFISWRAWRSPGRAPGVDDPASWQPRRLLAGVSVLLAAIFALAIAAQGAAAIVFTGCER